MEESVALFAAINFLVIGLSHLFQVAAWREFFQVLYAQGRAGAFANGFLTLLMGSVIVAFHNVWSGMPIVLTLVGWVYLAKSLAIFLFPDWNVRSMAGVQQASAVTLRAAGIALLAVAAVCATCVATGAYRASEPTGDPPRNERKTSAIPAPLAPQETRPCSILLSSAG